MLWCPGCCPAGVRATRLAVARRQEAEREAAGIIAAAHDRASGGNDPEPDSAAAAEELNRLVETLGTLKETALQGLEQVESLGDDIEAVVGER